MDRKKKMEDDQAFDRSSSIQNVPSLYYEEPSTLRATGHDDVGVNNDRQETRITRVSLKTSELPLDPHLGAPPSVTSATSTSTYDNIVSQPVTVTALPSSVDFFPPVSPSPSLETQDDACYIYDASSLSPTCCHDYIEGYCTECRPLSQHPDLIQCGDLLYWVIDEADNEVPMAIEEVEIESTRGDDPIDLALEAFRKVAEGMDLDSPEHTEEEIAEIKEIKEWLQQEPEESPTVR